MDANQRSEFNNQTNNGANEKWNEGATGKSAENGAPLDHTYPQGLGVQQQGNQGRDVMGTQQSGMGPGAAPGGMGGRANDRDAGIPGGSMETQVNGGSGTVQGITDSHQRQAEQKSGAYGMLEQPLGNRAGGSGTDLNHPRNVQQDDLRGQLPSQSVQQADLQGGSIGPRGGNLNLQGGTNQGSGMAGADFADPAAHSALGSVVNRQSASPSSSSSSSPSSASSPVASSSSSSSSSSTNQTAVRDGGMLPPRAGTGADAGGHEAQHGNMQEGVAGSRAGADQQSDAGGVHASNDVAGGLPRSPGNTGASTDRAGSQTGAHGAEGGPEVHRSNDAAGGYPRSPGFANRLAGDSNMDDDTGFKRKP
jgi:hypothetical protein